MRNGSNNVMKKSPMIPPTLKPGDVIDIVAPSAKCNPEAFQHIKALLDSWGLRSHIPEDLFGESLLYANTDEKRFEHLKNALLNKNSKGVWCLLGGYGANRLIPMLSQITPPPDPKIFIGFSDITALHIFLQNQWGWVTIHGPSGVQASQDKVAAESVALLKHILFDKNYKLSYQDIVPLNVLAEKRNVINAPMIGGNLHLIQVSLGTSWQINAQDKILFIEDINERAYRIDRVLAHLEQAGILKQAKAILFGDFVDKGEPDGKFLVQDALNDFAKECLLPVLQIRNVGHGTANHPILLGSQVKLKMGDSYSLEFF